MNRDCVTKNDCPEREPDCMINHNNSEKEKTLPI